MATSRYTVLVNSCDAFADCWEPFFRLFATYWPDCAAPIVLNTDRATYEHPGLEITSSQAAAGDPPDVVPSWAERTIRAVRAIDTEQVLYLQEDYFLNGNVRTDDVDRFSQIAHERGAACLRLLETHLSGPWRQTDDPDVWEVSRRASYYAHLQAAVWRRTDLLALLRAHETPWDFELLGSRRAKRMRGPQLCVNRDRFGAPEDQVVPYDPTGIVKGKWVEHRVIPLFPDHGIEVDFSVRGFYEEPTFGPRPLWVKVMDRVERLPTVLRSLR